MKKIVILATAVLTACAMTGCSDRPKEPQYRIVSKTKKIAAGDITVEAGKVVKYRIEIKPDMSDATLTGGFMASGGNGNDVAAALADEPNSINWSNGHDATLLWSTNGQKTTDSFSVQLDLGTYYLVISNSFSAWSDKNVAIHADLKYNQKQIIEP